MTKTFDFIFMAQRDVVLLKKIEYALLSQNDEVIYTNIHKLSFCVSKQMLRIEAISDNSPLHEKIVPKEIKYSAVTKMLNGKWDDIREDEIQDYRILYL